MSGWGGAGDGGARGAPSGASAAASVPVSTMVRPDQLADEAWLYNAPAFHNAVAWSEDNLLAVAAAHTVVIVSPADLNGVRQYAALPQPEPASARARDGPPPRTGVLRCHPRAAGESASLPILLLAEGEAAAAPALARAVAWSPAGCERRGAGCLLAVLSSDRRLRIYGPGPTPQHARWELVQDLSDALADHFEAAGWGDVDPPPAPPGAALRLRGGGRRSSAAAEGDAAAGKKEKAGGGKRRRAAQEQEQAGGDGAGPSGAGGARHAAATAAAATEEGEEGQEQPQAKRGRGRPRKNSAPQRRVQEDAPAAAGAAPAAAAAPVPPPTFAAGDAVEVMNDEDGLRGCWFAGRVSQLHGGLALVEYEELFADEEGTMPLREWFPLPPPARQAAAQAAAGPPPGDFPVHEGDGYLMRPPPPQQLAAFEEPPEPGVTLEMLRDGGWWICPITRVTRTHVAANIPGEPETVEVPLTDVRKLTMWNPETGVWGLAIPMVEGPAAGGAAGRGAAAPAVAASGPGTPKQKASSQRQSVQKAAQPQRRPSPLPSRSPSPSPPSSPNVGPGRGRRRAAARGLKRIALAEAEGDDISDDPASAAAAAAGGGGGRPGVVRPSQQRRAPRASDDTGSTDWQASEDEEDEETDSDEDLPQLMEDELVHEEPGAGSGEEGWEVSEDEGAGRRRGRGRGSRGGGRRGRGSRGGGRGRRSVGDGGADSGDGSDAGDAPEEEAWEFQEYEVPADLAPNTFTRLRNQPLPTDDAGWTRAAPEMIYERFAELRRQLEPHQVPSYAPRQHLRNHDLRLLTQAQAEFAALHAAAVAEQAPGLSEKELVKQTKILVRRHILGKAASSTPSGRGRGRGRGGGGRGRGRSSAVVAVSEGTQEVARTPAAGTAPRTPAGYLSTSIAQLACDAQAGAVSFLENPLLAVAKGLAAEAARNAGGAATGQQQQQAGGVAAERIRALPDAELEHEWHMQGTAAAPYVDQSLSVALVPVATRGGGAATYVRFTGASKRGVLYASELAKEFALMATPSVPNTVFEARRRFLAATAVAWSPVAVAPARGAEGRCCLLAVATQSGHIQLWRCILPSIEARAQSAGAQGDEEGAEQEPVLECLGAARAHGGSVTALSWAIVPSSSAGGEAGSASSSSTSSSVGGFFLPRRAGPGDTLVLATAGQDGSTKLWAADPWVASAADALSALGPALEPDQRQTMCLDLCVAPVDGADSGGGGSWQLLLGAGKALGGVLLWRSAPFDTAAASPEKLAAAVAAGTAATAAAACHGKNAITGLVLDPWAPGIVSCCLGGTLATWRLDAASGELVPAAAEVVAAAEEAGGSNDGSGSTSAAAAAPARLNPRGRPPPGAPTPLPAAARAKAPLLGVAASGNRLVVAAVRSLISSGSRDVEATEKSSMTYNHIAKAWLQLCLAPSCSPARPAAVLPPGMRAALAALPRRPALPASAVWDVASGVALAGWAPIELTPDQQQQVTAAAPPAGAANTKAGVDAARHARRLGQQLMRQSQLQAQWKALQQAVGVLMEPVPGGVESIPLSCPDPAAWRALRACAALRQALLLVWQGPQHVGEEFPAATSQLQPQITVLEMLLVQRHIWRALVERVGYCCSSSGGGGGQQQQQQGSKHKKGGKGSKHDQQQQGAQQAGGGVLPVESDPLARLSRLLMADWLNQQVGDPAVRRDLLPLAAAVYPDMRATAVLPPEPAPGREPNPFGEALPQVAMAGRGPEAAREAVVSLVPGAAAGGSSNGGGSELQLSRCAATLRVCGSAVPWRCVICTRRYMAPPTRVDPDAAGEDVPRCLVCGVRLAAGPEGCGSLDQPLLMLGPPSRVLKRVP